MNSVEILISPTYYDKLSNRDSCARNNWMPIMEKHMTIGVSSILCKAVSSDKGRLCILLNQAMKNSLRRCLRAL
jgi:hypothetical protein